MRGDLVVEKNLLYVIRDAHKKMFMIDDDEPKIPLFSVHQSGIELKN